MEAKLCKKSDFRTIREIQAEDEGLPRSGRRKRAKDRNVYFCLKYSRYFATPIHATITKWKKHFGLSWLRVRMSYSRFTNLGEKIASDLKTKVKKYIGLRSLDFVERRCNCSGSGGVCNYGGVGCRKSMIVYKVNCLHPGCGQFYIGQTSQHLKKRMSQHFQETRRSVLLGEKSDTC